MTDFVLYVVLLTNSLPEDILRSLGSYVHSLHGTLCLVSSRFQYDHPFVKLEILPPEDNKARTIWLPSQFVLAIEALESKEDAQKMGFLSKS